MRFGVRKAFLTCVLCAAACILFPAAVMAATFDKERLDDGLLGVTYDGGFDKMIMVYVTKAGDSGNYQYVARDNKKFFIPLQQGDGEYTVMLLKQAQGDQYSVLQQEKINLKLKNVNAMFTVPSPIVNYSGESTAIKAYMELMKSAGETNQKIDAAYKDVVERYTYDSDKASNPKPYYVPAIDEIYETRLAICYDYSAMLASVLRNIGVPTKLVMGYAPEITAYHAWNEIYIDGKWVVVDTTYDSAYFHAKYKYSMVKDASKFKVVKVY